MGTKCGFYRIGRQRDVGFFLTDSRYQNEHLGVYEGACTYPEGAYRPSEDSMMNSNTCAFNAPSRMSLYEKL